MSNVPEETLAVSVRRAAELTGLSLNTMYRLIQREEIEVRKSGSRTLVPYAVLKAYIEGLPRGTSPAPLLQAAAKKHHRDELS